MPGSTDAGFSDNFSDLGYSKPRRCCPLWLYNPSTGEFLGRTGKSWCLIFLFYVIFYIILTGFFMGMLLINLNFIIPAKVPLRTGANSLLKLNPGLAMRPNVDITDALIKYSVNDPQTSEPYIQSLDAFLKEYYVQNGKPAADFATCANGKKTPDDVEKVCKFDPKQLGECTVENKFGYKDKKPCVFLKMNKIYGWLPDISDNASVKSPFVNCTGQNPLDKENIGEIAYYPGNVNSYGTFDTSYFPYLGQRSYLAPVVAIQFKNLKLSTTVMVECHLYNLKSSEAYPSSVKFEMMVDM